MTRYSGLSLGSRFQEMAGPCSAKKLKGASSSTGRQHEVHEAYSRGTIVLIDVRTPPEFMFGHIEGALLSPLVFFNPKNMPSQGGKRIVFYCGSGVRSRRVAEQCLGAGEDAIAHMDGGFHNWKKMGLPFIGTDKSSGAPKRMVRE